MRRSRLRTWAKWTCTLAAGAWVALAVFSGFYECKKITVLNHRTKIRWFVVTGGLVTVHEARDPKLPSYYYTTNWWLERSTYWCWGLAVGDWRAGVLCSLNNWSHCSYGISLLYPVILTSIPAALLWYADRRRFGPGSCMKCGYDRRGLAADAKCPECGKIPSK